MNRANSLFYAGVGVGAWLLSESIYRFAIVPRLPGWRSVPIWWWVVQLLPLAAAVVFTGVVSQTPLKAVINGIFLVLPPIALVTAYGLVSGRPVAHDMWASDPFYWVVASAQLVLGILSVVLTAAISRAVIARRHGV